MCTKSYSTRFLCFSLYFCIRLHRALNFFLYEAVPPVIHNFLHMASVEQGNEYHIKRKLCITEGNDVPLTKNRLS